MKNTVFHWRTKIPLKAAVVIQERSEIHGDISEGSWKHKVTSFWKPRNVALTNKTHTPNELRKTVTWFDIKHTNVVYGASCNVGTSGMPAEAQDSTLGVVQQKRKWHTHKYTAKGNWVLLPQRSTGLAFYSFKVHLLRSCEGLFYIRWGTTLPWDPRWHIWYLLLIMDKWLMGV